MAHSHSHAPRALEGVLLPRDARPTRYAIFLAPDLAACTFAGRETVAIAVEAGRVGLRQVVLHSNQLYIWDVSYTPAGGKKLACEALAFDLKKQTVSRRRGAADLLGAHIVGRCRRPLLLSGPRRRPTAARSSSSRV